MAVVFFGIGIFVTLYLNQYVKESDQPKLSVRANKKPYLRYQLTGAKNIEFSYEMSFTNFGKNTAINISYITIIQKLLLNDKAVVEVTNSVGGIKTPSEAGYRPPPKLISGDKYFQIFQINGNDLSSNQINNLIDKFKKGELSIILDIEMEYDDAITQKRYKTHEIVNIYKDRSLILSPKT